jgi:hypothetical protein
MLPLAPILLLMTLLLMGGVGYIMPGPEIRTLQTCLTEAELDCKKQIALNVGGWTFGIGNMIARLANAPEEVRAALNTMRGVDVAVYRLATAANPQNVGTLLREADTRMEKRGWTRTVLVRQSDQTVAVYTRENSSNPTDLRVCALVVDTRNLVMVSARMDLKPGLEFLGKNHGLKQELNPDLSWSEGKARKTPPISLLDYWHAADYSGITQQAKIYV